LKDILTSRFMKVGIYGQFYHKEAARYVQELLNILGQKKIEVIIEKNFLNLIKANDQIHVKNSNLH